MEAIQKEREMRIQFCNYYNRYDDDDDSDLESNPSDDEDENARKNLTKEEIVERLLKKFDKICELCDGVYDEFYMEMDPYSSEIFLVKV